MTKIEKAQLQEKIANRVRNNLFQAFGLKEDGSQHSYNDKHKFEITLSDKALEMGYGYYGSSSYYTCNDEHSIMYVEQACNEMGWDIAKRAIHLAQQDAEQALKDAKKEAEEILTKIRRVDASAKIVEETTT